MAACTAVSDPADGKLTRPSRPRLRCGKYERTSRARNRGPFASSKDRSISALAASWRAFADGHGASRMKTSSSASNAFREERRTFRADSGDRRFHATTRTPSLSRLTRCSAPSEPAGVVVTTEMPFAQNRRTSAAPSGVSPSVTRTAFPIRADDTPRRRAGSTEGGCGGRWMGCLTAPLIAPPPLP